MGWEREDSKAVRVVCNGGGMARNSPGVVVKGRGTGVLRYRPVGVLGNCPSPGVWEKEGQTV
jgi:hypothetical protein